MRLVSSRLPCSLALAASFAISHALSAVTFTWDGGGDGVNWTDPLNWNSNSVPTGADDAVLGPGGVVTINAGVSVRSVQSDRALSIAGGSLTVSGGASLVKAALTLAAGTALSANGVGTSFAATNSVSVDGANLYATAGATLRLPTLRNYQKPDGCFDAVLQATGAGSLLDLSAVTNLYGGNCNWLRIQAVSGASVNFSNVVTLADGWVQALADGAGSLVDLRKLASVPSPDRWLSLEAYNSGQVLTPLLLGSPRVGLGLSNGGLLSTNQLVRVGSVTVSGMAVTLPAVTNVDGANLTVNAGASLSVPAVRQMSKPEGCGDMTWQANGGGAVLNLSAITNLYGGNCNWLRFQALAGGSINLSNLVTISDGWVIASADGAGSLVDLRKLASFPTVDRWLSLEAYNGGQVLTPLLLGGPRVGLGLSNGGMLNTNQLVRVGGVTVAGMALTLPAVTNVDGSSLTVNAGGSLSLPQVRQLIKADGCYDMNWYVTGPSASLNLPAVTNIYGGNCAWLRFRSWSGGTINLSNVVAITDGYLQVVADGAGSLVDLRKLASFGSVDRWLSLEAYNGGQVLTPLLADGQRVGLGLGGGSSLNTSQFFRLGGGSVDGAALTLPGITNIDGAAFTVSGGGSLAFPNIRRLAKPDGCYDVNWYATGLNSLIDLSAVTNIYGGNCGWLRLSSSGGGQIVLSNVVSITDGQLIVAADGAGSRVDLRKLASFPSLDRWLSLEAYNGGEVLTSAFAGGPRVGLGVSVGGLLSTNQFTRLGGITVAGTPFTLPAVTNVDGASVTVSSGGSLSLPQVRRLAKPDSCYDMNWYATGAGSWINLGPVTNAYGGDCGWLRLFALAGGQITLSNLVSSTNGQFIVRAEDAGSVVDLRQFTSFTSPNRWFSLEAANGGLVVCSNFTGGARVGVTLSGGGTMPTAQFRRLGGISVVGNAVTFAGLTNLDFASVAAYSGGKVLLPALQSLTKPLGCADMNWEANGADSRIDAPVLQTTVSTDGCGLVRLRAMFGGVLNFSNVLSVAGQAIEVLADGAGSVLDLSHLTSFLSPGPGVSTLTAQNGGVILLGTQAFLLANVNVNIPPGNPVLPPAVISGPNLTLYGTPWRSYLVERRSNLSPTNDWQLFKRVPLTNSLQQIAGAPPANTAFRLTEFIANPPLLDFFQVTSASNQVVMYGPPSNTWHILTATNLTPPAGWSTNSTITMTNSFRLLPPAASSGFQRYTRAKQR